MPKPIPTPYAPTLPPVQAEVEAVHEVYEAIAPHFSSTRYKPWPLVSTFLNSLPPNTLGLDSGAGNGKYVPLSMEKGREVVVLDMSFGLLGIARETHIRGSKTECLRAELGYDGWRRGLFDWAISIAAIHHLSTPERRRQSVQALIGSLIHNRQPPYSRFMIYVWAYEQGDGSKRKMGRKAKSTSPQAQALTTTTEGDVSIDVGVVEESLDKVSLGDGEKDTGNQNEEKVQDVLVPWVYQPKSPARQPGQSSAGESETPEPQVFHRYYHLFVKGELQQLVEDAARVDGYRILPALGDSSETSASHSDGGSDEGGKWLRIKGVGWEADNWWIEGEVGM